jgi:predicted component of type VI protein secretion system
MSNSRWNIYAADPQLEKRLLGDLEKERKARENRDWSQANDLKKSIRQMVKQLGATGASIERKFRDKERDESDAAKKKPEYFRAAAAKKRTPAKKNPPSKPEVLDVVQREGRALQYLKDNLAYAVKNLADEQDRINELVDTLESERKEDKLRAETSGQPLLVNDAQFEKELNSKKCAGISIVYETYDFIYKGLDHLADTLDTNEQITRETELTKVVKDFAKLFNTEKDPKEDPKALSEATGALWTAQKNLPTSLTSPSTLGRFRDCCGLMADAINALSKNNIKAPKVPNAMDEEDPRQLGFGFTARHYVRLAMGVEASGYDYRVTDREYLPRPLAAKYIKLLKARIGRGTQIQIIKSESIVPRGWDYGNYTVLAITPPGATESVKAAITLNIAKDETSGVATLDTPYGTIPVPRSNYPEQVVNWLTSEIGNLLKPERTASYYVRAALSQNNS